MKVLSKRILIKKSNKMNLRSLINNWFAAWDQGDFKNIPISDDFEHTSPFGTISGKQNYLKTVSENRDKFLGYTFDIHDEIYMQDRACVRYTARQGDNFSLDVSEWYYPKDGLIGKIIAYYHIGEIRQDRKI